MPSCHQDALQVACKRFSNPMMSLQGPLKKRTAWSHHKFSKKSSAIAANKSRSVAHFIQTKQLQFLCGGDRGVDQKFRIPAALKRLDGTQQPSFSDPNPWLKKGHAPTRPQLLLHLFKHSFCGSEPTRQDEWIIFLAFMATAEAPMLPYFHIKWNRLNAWAQVCTSVGRLQVQN